VLTATGFGTVLTGGIGNDHLSAAVDGGVFGVTLDGGRGNDELAGSYAGDTYVYNLGDGNDVIHDDVRSLSPDVAAFFAANPGTDAYQDKIAFGAGITAADVGGERVGDDLVLHVKGDQGSVTVAGWYDGTMFDKIESFTFADGTTLLASDVDHAIGQPSVGRVESGIGTLTGSQYDDSLTATGFGTRLEGGAGNDTLAAAVDGGIFDVAFVGGHGDDVLVGSYAGDSYFYDLGDGHDLIHDDVRALSPEVAAFFQANPETDTYQDHLVFGDGITADSVARLRVGDDLVLVTPHGSEAPTASDAGVTIEGWFDGTGLNRIELIGFADGTTWTAQMAEQGLA
jgi:Ca2+-binding RTX toxin-like protein